MPTKLKKSQADQLNQADVAINNTLASADIKALVAKRGYTVKKLTTLKGLLDQTQVALGVKAAVKGAKELSTDQLEQIYHDAHLAYQDLAKTARRVFAAEQAKLTMLGLDGKEPRATAGFTLAAYRLFDNAALPDLQPALEDDGYTAEFLASERAKIEAFDEGNQVQEAAKGTSEGGTSAQNALLAKLHKAVMDYLAVAKIALRDRPDLQEQLGIKVRNTKTKAQQAAPRKAAATRAAKKKTT